MPALIAILIADDLTGSLDSLAPFAALGAECLTAVSVEGIGAALALSPEVLSVNLGTRELPPDEAGARAEAATRLLMRAAGPGTVWIKKIDSRLKGPIAAEITAMSGLLQPNRVLLCPAIPDLGRVVSDGHLRGHGVAEDLPVAATVGLPCEVPDATSAADLDRLAASVATGDLVAAARGLASALAARLFPGRQPVPAVLPAGPIGFAIGSRDPVTLAQLTGLCADGGPEVTLAPDGGVGPGAASGSFVIQATAGPGASGRQVAERLAEGVVRRVGQLASLLLTGGETAAAVLDAAGIRVLRTEGEVLPGLPLCRAVDRPGWPVLITKSGGFGPPDTLQRLWQAAQVSEGCP